MCVCVCVHAWMDGLAPETALRASLVKHLHMTNKPFPIPIRLLLPPSHHTSLPHGFHIHTHRAGIYQLLYSIEIQTYRYLIWDAMSSTHFPNNRHYTRIVLTAHAWKQMVFNLRIPSI